MEEKIMSSNLKNKIKLYFDQNWYDETIPDEVRERYDDEFESIIKEYKWNNVYPVLKDILINDCNDEASIVNWCHHFWDYALIYEYKVPNPEMLVAYLYSKVDIVNNSDAFDILDTIAISVLPINLMETPCYAANADPKIQHLIEDLKSGKIQF